MLNLLDKLLTRPERVYRLVCLFSCTVTGLSVIFTHYYSGPSQDMAGLVDVVWRYGGFHFSTQWVLFFDLTCYVLFGCAFWRAMNGEGLLYPAGSSVNLLWLQITVGFLVSPVLFFIVVSEACFIMKPRRASILALLLSLLGIALILAMPSEEAIGLASGVLFGVQQPPHFIAVLLQCLMFPMILLFSYCLGLLGATEWRHRRELAMVNAELKATQQLQAQSARLAERLYISRELHDAMGHHLAALSVNLQLASLLTEGEAAAPIREAHLIARTLLADVREVVSTLREDVATNLQSAIETLASGVKHPAIHIEINDELKDADPLQAHTLFRCTQEIITNAIRHAGAQNLWLKLTRDANGVSLSARDDGQGADSVNPGNGLRGMRERVEEFGGRLNLEAQRGTGFIAEIYLPNAGGVG